MAETIKVIISKNDQKSKILDENVSALIETNAADAYIQLIKKTWPQTKVKVLK